MITFETQEEFEDAVMAVLGDRLDVVLQKRYNDRYSDDFKLQLTIRDNKTFECIAEDSVG